MIELVNTKIDFILFYKLIKTTIKIFQRFFSKPPNFLISFWFQNLAFSEP